MDGTECKRCKEPDTFDTFCDECDDLIFKRTNKLIARSRNAKNNADTVCKLLGIGSLHTFDEFKESHTDQEASEIASGIESTPENYKKFLLCSRLTQLIQERDGWAELAMMSNRIPFDDDYLQAEIEAAKWEPTDN